MENAIGKTSELRISETSIIRCSAHTQCTAHIQSISFCSLLFAAYILYMYIQHIKAVNSRRHILKYKF